VDTDNDKAPRTAKNTSQPPKPRPSRPLPPRSRPQEEEGTSAGGGNLVQLQTDPPPTDRDSHDPPAPASQDFFSQTDWQTKEAEMEGYHAFRDLNGDSDSDSSSSDSSSSSDDEFGGFTKPTNNEGFIANFGAFSTAESAPAEKLVDLSFSNDHTPTNSSKTAVSALDDPWASSQVRLAEY